MVKECHGTKARYEERPPELCGFIDDRVSSGEHTFRIATTLSLLAVTACAPYLESQARQEA